MFITRAYARGMGFKPPLSLIFSKSFVIRGVYRAWFFTKIRGVHEEEFAYYVNKLRLKTWIWRTSQKAHTKCNDHHTPLNEKPPLKFSAYATCSSTVANIFKHWVLLFNQYSKSLLQWRNWRGGITGLRKTRFFSKKTTHLFFFVFLKRNKILFFFCRKQRNPILNCFYFIMQYHYFQNYTIITCYSYYGIQNWG